MMQSLLIKVAMLAMTLGSLIWIASVTPVTKVMPRQPQLLARSPVATVSSPQPLTVTAPRPTAASASRAVTLPDRPVPRPVEEPGLPGLQEKAPADSRPARQTISRQVDLNQATVSDLEALPGIGPRLAQRVIEHRDERGPFRTVEDLRRVRGIGRKKFDRLRPYVLVTNTRTLARHKGAL